MLLWREEIDDVELFMPMDSIVRLDAAWVKKNFGDDLRYESIIVTAPNVLEPEVLQTVKNKNQGIHGNMKENNFTKFAPIEIFIRALLCNKFRSIMNFI